MPTVLYHHIKFDFHFLYSKQNKTKNSTAHSFISGVILFLKVKGCHATKVLD